MTVQQARPHNQIKGHCEPNKNTPGEATEQQSKPAQDPKIHDSMSHLHYLLINTNEKLKTC